MTVDLRAALTESLDIYGELYAAHNTLRERYRMVLLPGHPRIVALRGMLRALPAPPPPEPRRPVVGWARQRNGDETWSDALPRLPAGRLTVATPRRRSRAA